MSFQLLLSRRPSFLSFFIWRGGSHMSPPHPGKVTHTRHSGGGPLTLDQWWNRLQKSQFPVYFVCVYYQFGVHKITFHIVLKLPYVDDMEGCLLIKARTDSKNRLDRVADSESKAQRAYWIRTSWSPYPSDRMTIDEAVWPERLVRRKAPSLL